MELCNEDTAKFMGEALLNHAKDICRYARTYNEANLAASDENARGKFTTRVERMINGMYALMLMAKYKGITRFCNREQIDAYVEEARSVIEAPVAFAGSTSALLN